VGNQVQQNLKSWQKGQSGNPAGRPKGARNLKTIVRDLLNDRDAYKHLDIEYTHQTLTPIEAIILALTQKALSGSDQAASILLKHYAIGEDKLANDDLLTRTPVALVQFIGDDDSTSQVDYQVATS